tara:strand:- start:936 stop:1784 length:849 start_codon:yes stop_codon:yes gene_type:complete
MKVDLSSPPIGVLGLGHLGSLLGLKYSNIYGSWGSWHKKPPKNLFLQNFKFEWGKKQSWKKIPEKEVTLILTIPPLMDSLEKESIRLYKWCDWMKKYRPKLKRIVYVSTTGVYPKKNGFWHEKLKCEPDTNSGKLRLLTEKILSEYFSVNIVRSGGIYGYGRGIDVRLKSGKPIPVSRTPVHRIHVYDLSQIIIFIVKNPESASCINAVDFEAKPSFEVAQWIVENCSGFSKKMLSISKDLSPRKKELTERFISNKLLIEMGIKLRYPTFREGIKDIIKKSE